MNANSVLNFLRARDDIVAKNELMRKQEEYKNAVKDIDLTKFKPLGSKPLDPLSVHY